MNKRSRNKLVYGALMSIIILVTLIAVVTAPSKNKNSDVDTTQHTYQTKTCPEEAKLRQFFTTFENEFANWNAKYYSVVLTAKRMGHEKYEEYLAFEKHPSINIDDLIAMTSGETCDVSLIKSQRASWIKWHKDRIVFLKNFQHDYPKVVNLSDVNETPLLN